jgi:NADH-quinone oxidoreductase subunit N
MSWNWTMADAQALLPLMVVSAAAVVVLLVLACCRRAGVAGILPAGETPATRIGAVLTVIALAAALALLPVAGAAAPRSVTFLVIVDGYGLFFAGLLLSACIAVALLGHSYFRQETSAGGEFYVLLLLAAAGAMTLVFSRHFASFFLGLEILSVSLYALAAYNRASLAGLEAGVKYLVLAASSASFLLLGMAFVYAKTGTMDLGRLAQLLNAAPQPALVTVGLLLIMVGVGFKLALVPFHLWTADVYQGAPAAVTAFIATVSKGAMFALLMRYLVGVNFTLQYPLLAVLTAVAVGSMFVGNLLALRQENVKRLLAYSSIAQLGYLLVTLLAAGPGGRELAVQAAGGFLAAYFIATLGAFGVVSLLSSPQREAESFDDYRGLAWRHPVLAGVLAAMLLSLAGIPLTVGFIGKFYVLAAGVNANLAALVAAMVINSGIGLYYYLRLAIALFTPSRAEPPPRVAIHPAGAAVLAVLTVLLVAVGVYPQPLLRLLAAVVAL